MRCAWRNGGLTLIAFSVTGHFDGLWGVFGFIGVVESENSSHDSDVSRCYVMTGTVELISWRLEIEVVAAARF